MKLEIKDTSQQEQAVQKKSHKGFTLIELLVSMSITLIIVGLLMGMTKMAVGAWQRTHAKTRSSRLAQEVFDYVGKDLEGMVIRTGNSYEWLLIKGSGNTLVENGPQGRASSKMLNPLEFSFFSAVTDRYNGQINVSGVDMGGDISMVRYRLIHQDLIGAGAGTEKPVFALYRQRINPDDTFDDMLAQTSIDAVDRGYPSSQIVSEPNYLAENIFDFTLSFNFEYTLSGAKGYKRVVVQNNGINKSLSIKGNEIIVNGVSLQTQLPAGASSPRLAGADVSILVLSDSGMNGLKNKNITTDAQFSKYLKEKGHHYSKSVIIPRP
jgi:prepilin-type N-terminal cleavage/methylation domain-containing protein